MPSLFKEIETHSYEIKLDNQNGGKKEKTNIFTFEIHIKRTLTFTASENLVYPNTGLTFQILIYMLHFKHWTS